MFLMQILGFSLILPDAFAGDDDETIVEGSGLHCCTYFRKRGTFPFYSLVKAAGFKQASACLSFSIALSTSIVFS